MKEQKDINYDYEQRIRKIVLFSLNKRVCPKCNNKLSKPRGIFKASTKCRKCRLEYISHLNYSGIYYYIKPFPDRLRKFWIRLLITMAIGGMKSWKDYKQENSQLHSKPKRRPTSSRRIMR